MPEMIAPDVGTLVEYDGASYRVESWLRVKRREMTAHEILDQGMPCSGKPSMRAILDAILYESAYETARKHGEELLEWCTREDATHLCLVGVCGATAKIEDCKITGRVNWTEEMIDDLRQQALAFVGEMAD